MSKFRKINLIIRMTWQTGVSHIGLSSFTLLNSPSTTKTITARLSNFVLVSNVFQLCVEPFAIFRISLCMQFLDNIKKEWQKQ